MREDMKTLIADTFSRLLEKENIDKITVKRLIEECHISRQTFYYHFKDIMDVLEWAFGRSAMEIARRSLKEENHREAIKVFVSFVKTHRNKLRRLQYSKNWNQIERLFLKSTVLFLEQIMKEKFPDLKITYENRNVLLNFYACGMAGILLAYTGEEEEEDEKFISQIDWIISRTMIRE